MTKDKGKDPLTSIDQAELDDIIAKHEAFQQGRSNGKRAQLAHCDLSYRVFRGRNLSHADFTGSVLYKADFENASLNFCEMYACDLRKANFKNARLVRADLRGSCLRGSIMSGADLTEADLREGTFATYDPEKGLSFVSESEAWADGVGGVDMRGANLGSVKMTGAIATNSNFEDANLSKSVIIRGNLAGANLKGANLAGADLSHCELKNVCLREANLTGALIDYSTLNNVDLKGALTDRPQGNTLDNLAQPLEELLRLHQIWLKTNGQDGKRLDLSHYDLRSAPSFAGMNLTMIIAEDCTCFGLDFSQINLQAARLRDSNFRNCAFTAADLRGSMFASCSMAGAKFTKANCRPLILEGGRQMITTFANANLRYADFSQAILRDCDFTGADLSFANFAGADTIGADFRRANLHETKIEGR